MKYHQPFDQPDNPDAGYVNANPALGVRGSIPPAEAFEQTQREIIKVITEAGLTPSDTDLTQLWQALQSIAGTIVNTAITNYLTGGSVDVNIPYAVAGGTRDAITATFSPALGSLVDGQVVLLKVGSLSNATTTPTLNANSLGAKVISRNDGSTVAVGDLVANGFAVLVYDTSTTAWKFVAGIATSGGGGGSFVPGCYYDWPLETPPTGLLECNGAAISRTTYSRLFGIINTKFGPGDGSTTFNLPDWRGEFQRFWDHGRGLDPDRSTRTNRGDGTTGDAPGTKQGGAAGPISLTGTGSISGPGSVSGTGSLDWGGGNPLNGPSGEAIPGLIKGSITNPGAATLPTTAGVSIPTATISVGGTLGVSGNSGASETRPHNMTSMRCIAY